MAKLQAVKAKELDVCGSLVLSNLATYINPYTMFFLYCDGTVNKTFMDLH